MADDDMVVLLRLAEWVGRLPDLPEDIPYWKNGMFSSDCQDAREVLIEISARNSSAKG